MKKVIVLFAGFVWLSWGMVNQAVAQDGFFSDARVIDYEQFAVGLQPIIYTDEDSEFMLMFRAGYGIQPNLSFHGKLGIFREETYVGGHLKYQLLNEFDHPVAFSVLGGAYMFGEIGLKLSGVISKNLGSFHLYGGVTFEPIFTTPARAPVLVPVGVTIPASPRLDFIFEADLAINSVAIPYQALTFGLNFTI